MELKTFYTSLSPEGIAITRVKRHAEVTLIEAQENTNAILQLTGGKACPLLVDVRGICSITKEARDHFAMRDRTPRVNSIAMLIQSPVSRIIGNFYMQLNRPVVPTRLFTDENTALDWLKTYLN